MADIFISFKTDDTPRVQAVYDGFRARGLTVFLVQRYPQGAPDYHAIIKAEIREAPVVVVVWTHNSVLSHPSPRKAPRRSGTTNSSKSFWTISVYRFPHGGEVQSSENDAAGLDPTRTIPNGSSSTAQSTPGWDEGRVPCRLQRRRLQPTGAGFRSSQTGARGGGWLDKAKAFVGGHAPVVPALWPGKTRAVARPAWASDAGRDKFGVWADFALAGVRQRMRWIEPGTFQMGSPEKEDGRFDNEGPRHEVRLTKGFWLGDTPVTQALWTAAMGNNRVPSKVRSGR